MCEPTAAFPHPFSITQPFFFPAILSVTRPPPALITQPHSAAISLLNLIQSYLAFLKLSLLFSLSRLSHSSSIFLSALNRLTQPFSAFRGLTQTYSALFSLTQPFSALLGLSQPYSAFPASLSRAQPDSAFLGISLIQPYSPSFYLASP